MLRKILKKKRIYLDYASATPIDKDVLKVIQKLSGLFANPDSLYTEGREARKQIEESKKSVAKNLGCQSNEIIFTSGGTESNNLAISGILEHFLKNNKGVIPHVVSSTIEHSSVLELFVKLDKKIELTLIEPNEDGIINPRDVRDALKSNTILVSIMYANNEVGTVEPIRDISKVIRKYRNDNPNQFGRHYPIFHTDACQAANYLSLTTELLGVDLMSLDGGKIYGLKGTGCLYKRKNIKLVPQMIGGGQENGLRSGTENILGITSFGKALDITEKIREKESKRLKVLQEYFFKKLLEIKDASINGSKTERLPNNVSVCIKGMDAEYMVFVLDEAGISVSSASTCMNMKEDSYSYVVKSIRKNDECEKSTLRFTMGRGTTKDEIDRCIKILKERINLSLKAESLK